MNAETPTTTNFTDANKGGGQRGSASLYHRRLAPTLAQALLTVDGHDLQDSPYDGFKHGSMRPQSLLEGLSVNNRGAILSTPQRSAASSGERSLEGLGTPVSSRMASRDRRGTVHFALSVSALRWNGMTNSSSKKKLENAEKKKRKTPPVSSDFSAETAGLAALFGSTRQSTDPARRSRRLSRKP